MDDKWKFEWHTIEEIKEYGNYPSVDAARQDIYRESGWDRKRKRNKMLYRKHPTKQSGQTEDSDTSDFRLSDTERYEKARADKMEQDAETAKLKNLAEREKMILDAIDIMNRLLFDSFAEFRDIIASHTDNRGRISLTKKEFNAAADEALEAHAQKNVAELIHKFYTDTPESD